MKSIIRTLAHLGDDLVIAPERWLSGADLGAGVPLGELVAERRERAAEPPTLVVDVTHARDGYIDLPAVRRASAEPGLRSTKKDVRANDVVVSRLRPYLRQVAFVHPATLVHGPLSLSTEFYVLAPMSDSDDIAWLVPFLLAPKTQELLAAAQEGGHHPRVPRPTLLGLRVPPELVARREELARRTRRVLDAFYAAMTAWTRLLSEPVP